MPGPGVSVALCTHNGAQFIGEQLASIFAQTHPADEVVVSDDASRDATVELVRAAFAAHPNPPRLTLIENPVALGVTRNFQQAIEACSNEIVVLSDQDDVWSPTRIERTLAAFDDPDVVLVHSDARLIDGGGAVLGSSLFDAYRVDPTVRAEIAGGRAFDQFLRRNLVTGATAAIRRRLAEAAAPFPAEWVHDEWLAVVASSIGRIVPLDDRLIDYRQHGGNEIGAVELTLRGKLGRLVAPGRQRNERLLARAIVLAERLPSITDDAAALESARQKVEHERVRSALGPHRLTRIGPVLREWRTGRYRRFGGGLQDVARDLIQPLTSSPTPHN